MSDKDEKLDKYVQAAAEARIMDELICMIHDDFSEIISGAKCNKFLDKSGKALDKIKIRLTSASLMHFQESEAMHLFFGRISSMASCMLRLGINMIHWQWRGLKKL